MKKKLTKNWGLKLIAMVSAVLIWLLIMNTTDPETTFTISGIPITFLHEESILNNDMVYEVIGSRTVSVSVTTRTRDQGKISEKNFIATADLNEIYGINSRVEIKVQLVNKEGDDYDVGSVVRKWDQTVFGVQIVTENVVTKDFEIEVVQEGQVSDGYDYWQCTLSQNKVSVKAPESQLRKIGGVKAIVDVSESAQSGKMTVPLTFYDTSGKEIKDLESIDASATAGTVEVDAVVQKTSPVSLDVVVQNKDKVSAGYRYITYRISRQSISVIGTMQAVAGLDKIQIEVDAADAKGYLRKQIDIMDYLPENVTVAGDDTLITIELVIEPEGSIDIEVPVENIAIKGEDSELLYLFAEDSVTVNIFGLKSDWEDLTAEDIQLSLDLRGLEAGEHVLKPVVEEIEGLTLEVTGELNLTIESVPEETTEGESEESTESETGDFTGDETGESTEGSTEDESEGSSESDAEASATEDAGTEESAETKERGGFWGAFGW